MGQWRQEDGKGKIYLVEDVEDVLNMEVEQPENFAYTTQTTLSVDETRDVIEALKKRFPLIQGPKHDDICYATQNRQEAVNRRIPWDKKLTMKKLVAFVLIVGILVVTTLTSLSASRRRERSSPELSSSAQPG